MTAPDRTLETDYAAPSRDLYKIRRALIAVLVLTVVLPLMYLAIYGRMDLHRRQLQANESIDRLARVAQEHAVKIIDMNAELQARVLDGLNTRSGSDISHDQRQMYYWLSRLIEAYPQVAALSIFDSNGTLLATSRAYPVPPVNINGREDFIGARGVWPSKYFSLPLRGAVSNNEVFTTSVARLDAQQQFLGVVTVALKREYFVDFYHDLIGHNASLTMSLYRRDGGLIAQYPPVPFDAPQQAVDPQFARALREETLAGMIHTEAAHGEPDRVLAFRRVNDYPLYVSASVDEHSILQGWIVHMVLVSLVTLIPSAAIVWLVFYALRWVKADEGAWDRWRLGYERHVIADRQAAQEHRMEGFGNLAATIAHDFNNMLMVVSSNIDVAKKKHFFGIDLEVESIERAIGAGQAITRRLLGISGKQPLNRENIALPEWFHHADTLIQSAAGPAARISYDVRDDTWPVFVDPRELELAVVNIAINAREAMADRSQAQLRIATRNVRLPDGQHELAPGRYVVLSVSDNGRGMSPEVLRRALEPMFSTKASGTGAGLGLAHVLAFCRQSGGTVRLESSMGIGTAVRVYLPGSTGAVASVADEPAVDVAPEASGGGHPHILIIEDNIEVAAGMEAVLELMDCDVTHAPNADEALKLLSIGAAFDLMLSDIHMPGSMNGIDFAEHIRKEMPMQRIVLMTGYAHELDRANERFDVLAKPFDLNVLGAIVKDLRAHAL
ncbi:two-component system, cell cycle sensor histidine kinase and response regulator CckA [Pararobbsia alpina]|uniref:hybrid sensor histidine kinase/response regulator n=1 Tax=Pararobbsia alpina TaxID=621374 RepID=UPI0039A502F5